MLARPYVKLSSSHENYTAGQMWSDRAQEEAEVTHKEEGLRIHQARIILEAHAMAEAAKAEEQSRLLHVELQAKLQELAALEEPTTLAFAEQREKMSKASHEMAMHLHEL